MENRTVQASDFEEIYNKLSPAVYGKNFYYVENTRVRKNGDIEVSVSERYMEGLVMVESKVYKKSFPAKAIFSYYTKHCPPNRFAAVNFEGEIERKKVKSRHQLEHIRNNPASDLNFYKFLGNYCFFTALKKAMESSIRYDSPYGSGKSPYSIPAYLGVYGVEGQSKSAA